MPLSSVARQKAVGAQADHPKGEILAGKATETAALAEKAIEMAALVEATGTGTVVPAAGHVVKAIVVAKINN